MVSGTLSVQEWSGSEMGHRGGRGWEGCERAWASASCWTGSGLWLHLSVTSPSHGKAEGTQGHWTCLQAWSSCLSLQTVEHGFPHQPSALGYSPSLRVLAIGTRSGAVKLYPFQCPAPTSGVGRDWRVFFSLLARGL